VCCAPVFVLVCVGPWPFIFSPDSFSFSRSCLVCVPSLLFRLLYFRLLRLLCFLRCAFPSSLGLPAFFAPSLSVLPPFVRCPPCLPFCASPSSPVPLLSTPFWVFCSGSFVLGLLFCVLTCVDFLFSRLSLFLSRGFPAPSLLAVRSFPPSVFAPAVLSRVLGCFSGPRAFSPAFLVYLVPSVLLPPLFPPRCLLSFSSTTLLLFSRRCLLSSCLLSSFPLFFSSSSSSPPLFLLPLSLFCLRLFCLRFFACVCAVPASCPTVVILLLLPLFCLRLLCLRLCCPRLLARLLFLRLSCPRRRCPPLLPALWPSLTVVVALLALPVEAGFLFASSFF
jgi:hypothetical protein